MPRSLITLALVLPLSLVFAAGCGGTDDVVPVDGTGDAGGDTGLASGDTGSGSGDTGSGSGDTGSGSDDTGSGSDDTGSGSGDTGSGSGDTGSGSGDTGSGSGDTGLSSGDTGVADTKTSDVGTGDAFSDTTSVGDAKLDADAADGETAAPIGPAPVLLGMSGDYVILAKSEITTVPASIITGDLGLSPAAASVMTGFSPTKVGTYWTSLQVKGKIFAADNDPPTPTLLTTAITNMQTAYTDAATRPTPGYLNLGVGAIGGLTLTPGLYRWTSTVTIASDVTFSGAADDTWILQITGDLTESSAKRVKLLGGAKAKNIVWQVAGLVDLGTTSHFEGVILCKTGIAMRTGATINGRLLAQTAVTLDTSTVTVPIP